LHSVIGDGRIPAALRSRFIEVLQTVGFDELARADTKMLGMALIFARDQARAISDERLIRRMGEILMGFAPVAASLANDEKAALPLLLALPNALMSWPLCPATKPKARGGFLTFRRFAELCPPVALRISAASMEWAKRLTVVTDVHWITEAAKFFGVFIPCPVKIYANERLSEAKRWITE
jgi:hypothetical protein